MQQFCEERCGEATAASTIPLELKRRPEYRRKAGTLADSEELNTPSITWYRKTA